MRISIRRIGEKVGSVFGSAFLFDYEPRLSYIHPVHKREDDGMQIFVGNLPLEFTDDELKNLFKEFGTVQAAAIGRDKKTGEPAGYGIVDMPVRSEMRSAVDALRGRKMNGKPLLVRPLKPDDPFHGSVIPVKGQSTKGSGNFRGDSSYRGSGAIRRGGQRGS